VIEFAFRCGVEVRAVHELEQRVVGGAGVRDVALHSFGVGGRFRDATKRGGGVDFDQKELDLVTFKLLTEFLLAFEEVHEPASYVTSFLGIRCFQQDGGWRDCISAERKIAAEKENLSWPKGLEKKGAPAWDRGPRKARFVASVVFTPAAWGHPS
jgi:hypothetical protein